MLRLKKDLKKVAVTGGLCSGKSLVCKFFKEFGAYVVSADEIVHDLLSSNQEIIQKVVKLLGNDILVDHHIDRSKVAKKVFNQQPLLKSLEHILHWAVLEEIKNQYELNNVEALYPLFVAEVPLLFETESHLFFDDTIAVIADVEVCKKRFEMFRGTDDEFTKRQERQLSNQEKSEKADYVILNNDSLIDLKKTVLKLYETLKTKP